MKWEIRQKVDLQVMTPQRATPECLFMVGNAQAHRWKVEVYSGGTPVDIDGRLVVAMVQRPDGLVAMLKGIAQSNVAEVVLDSACCGVAGHAQALMTLTSNDQVITVAEMRFRVGGDLGDTVIDSSDMLPSLSELLSQVADMRAATEECVAATDEMRELLGNAGSVGGSSGSGGTGTVTSVNGIKPDAAGNVEMEIPQAAEDVGADPAGTAASKVSTHNADEEAHPAIRQLVTTLSGRLNALADSDDTTLDQLSEIVAYIKSNKSLIDSITTGKVSTADIVNNLTSTATNKPLSAAQGKALKALIDAIVVPTKTSQLTNDSGYLTEHQDISHLLPRTELGAAVDVALAEAKASGAFDGEDGRDGKTPVAGVDYYTPEDKTEFTEYIAAELAKRGQLKPEFANSIDDCTDESKLYVLPDGYIYAYLKRLETVEGGPNFTNLLTASTTEIKEHTRYSQSSAAFKTGVTNVDSVIIPIPSGDITLRFRGISYGKYSTSDYYPYIYGGKSNTNFTATTFVSGVDKWTPGADGDIVITFTNSSGCTHAVMMLDHKAMSTGIVTLNEEITYTEGGTTVVEGWESTGHAFVPADYEDRIIALEDDTFALNEAVENLEDDVASLKARPVSSMISMMVYAPSPQLPADGSETADFDAANINANEIYDYIDALVAKHPRYLTKETLGKDESGTYDWNRYTASRRTYDAWVKPTNPAMYAWVNASTTVYSVSVSPRVGDTMYTTSYIGTAYSTVTEVDTPNQTRTVDGLVFARDKSKDVAPTLVYTLTDYDSRRLGVHATWHNSVYSASRSKIATITSITGGTLTDSNGDSYNRYPMGDRNSIFARMPVLVLGANEHGGNESGDPAEAAIITARLIKDLCECRNADNAMLNMIKSEYMVVFCPVINPWGYGKETGYCNANGVNIDRNFDTPGWGNDSDQRHGDYGGSENETQFFMNTVYASGAKIALANHVLGAVVDSATGEIGSAGFCGYMLGRDDGKYSTHLAEIAETMSVNYDYTLNNIGQAPADEYGKTRSYLDHIGVEGGALEMSAIDGYILHGGARHTAKVLEADYTLLLQFLQMLIECQEG